MDRGGGGACKELLRRFKVPEMSRKRALTTDTNLSHHRLVLL